MIPGGCQTRQHNVYKICQLPIKPFLMNTMSPIKYNSGLLLVVYCRSSTMCLQLMFVQMAVSLYSRTT